MIRSLIIAITLAASISVAAQTPTPTPDDDSDIQSWNDASITRPLSKRVDLVLPLTLRFGKNISRVQETRVGAAIAFKPHSRLTITPGYSFIRSRNTAGVFRRENRLLLAAVFRFPVNGFGLSHRSLFEYRIRQSGRSWRYRPSLTAEKKLPDSWIKGAKVYVTEEPFYDSTEDRFSRNRLSFGLNKTLTKNLSVDLFYLRQDDRNSSINPIHAIGTHWRIRL
jgi:hypothetical protein